MYLHRYSTPFPPSSSSAISASSSSGRYHHHRPISRRHHHRPSTSHTERSLSKPSFGSSSGSATRRRPSQHKHHAAQAITTRTARRATKSAKSRAPKSSLTMIKASPILGFGLNGAGVGSKRKADGASANSSLLSLIQNSSSKLKHSPNSSRSANMPRAYTRTRRQPKSSKASKKNSKEPDRDKDGSAMMERLLSNRSTASVSRPPTLRKRARLKPKSGSYRVQNKQSRHNRKTLKKLQSLFGHSSASHAQIGHSELGQNQLGHGQVGHNRKENMHPLLQRGGDLLFVDKNAMSPSSPQLSPGAALDKHKLKATVSSQSVRHRGHGQYRRTKKREARSAHMIPHTSQSQSHAASRTKSGSAHRRSSKARKHGSAHRSARHTSGSSKRSGSNSLSMAGNKGVAGKAANLSMSDLSIKSLLGEGAFSKVFLVAFKDAALGKSLLGKSPSAAQVALKVIPRRAGGGAKKKESKNLVWERLVLSQLSHPFIVSFFGSFYDAKRVCILMEFIIGGEILYHFENCRLGRFPPTVSRFYIAEIICALEYVHAAGFIYRDLKPENVLLDRQGHIKLVDFGFAKQLARDELTYTLCGSKEYVAPEVLVGHGHGKHVDLWSLGVLTFEFVVGHLPFPTQDSNPYQVLDIIKSTSLVFPRFVSKIVEDFILKLLTLDPRKRPPIAQIKAHEWFTEFDWKACNDKQLTPPIAPKYSADDDVANFANARFEDNAAENSQIANGAAFKDLALF